MKKLITIALTLFITAPAFAQKYLKEDMNSVIRNPKVGYGLCQYNQTAILNLLIKDSESRIHRTALAIQEERSLSTKKARVRIYTQQMYKLMINQIMLVKMRDQLNEKGLYNLILASEKNKTLSVLQLENTRINIEVELLNSLHRSLNQYRLKDFTAGSIEYLKEEMYKELLKSLITGPYQVAVSSELRTQIARFLAGQISRQIVNQTLKSSLTQFGKHLAMDLGRGAIVEILTIPLTTYIQPDEGKLIDLAEEVPELLINPEWINPQGSKVPARYAWKTHCLAILRKPETIEFILNKYRASVKKDFANEMRVMKEIAEDERNWSTTIQR